MIEIPRPIGVRETYGCQMNVSDSELILGKLAESGYDSVDQPDGADVILINTCAIREHAEQRVIGRIGEMKSRMKSDAVLGITGCMAQRLGSQILDRAKHVSLVIGPDGYRDLPALIESARGGLRTTAVEFDLEEHYEDFRPRRFDGVKAWIPAARLRLPLHVLYRALHPRRRAQSPARRCRARGGAGRGRWDERSGSPRANGELVSRRRL
jgi:tRNA-2-methylthio-N6-dimethylallyladenosine synthase